MTTIYFTIYLACTIGLVSIFAYHLRDYIITQHRIRTREKLRKQLTKFFNPDDKL